MSSVSKLIEVGKRRADNWVNTLTGLGDALRDKFMATQWVNNLRLSDEYLENLYHGEDVAARIVEQLPHDGLRKWFRIGTDDDDAEFNNAVQERLKELGAKKALREAAIWGRCLGGAVVYLGIEDGQAEDQPVNIEAISAVKFLTVLDKRDIYPYTYSNSLERFGEPETYKIQTTTSFGGQGGGSQVIDTSIPIHYTRLLRFGGALTSGRRQQNNAGWDESVLLKVHDVLTQFNIGWQGTSHLLQDAAQGVFKLKGLIDMIASGDKEILQSRMQTVEMGRSIARAILLDADVEEYERQDYSFAGIPDVLRAFMLRLASAARMPVTILMGQAPAGLNATGESDIRVWYDSVQSWQEDVLLPHLELLVRYVGAELGETVPDEFEINFNSLWQVTDKEQAELEKAIAERDAVYIDRGVLLPEEVAISRFTPGGFSLHTQIDIDSRKEMLQAEIDLAKDQAGQDPVERAAAMAAAAGGPDSDSSDDDDPSSEE